MINSDRHPLRKSTSTDVIISNQHPFQILRSMADLLVRVRAYVSGYQFQKIRNSHRFENWTQIWEFEKEHRFENWTLIWEFEKKDIDLRYRCLWCRNRTWIWGFGFVLDNTLSWIFIVLAHWNNSPWLDMWPHSDTLSWFQANQSLLFLLNRSNKNPKMSYGKLKRTQKKIDLKAYILWSLTNLWVKYWFTANTWVMTKKKFKTQSL